MPDRRWWLAATLLVATACQAPVPATPQPTAAPVQPTAAVAKPTTATAASPGPSLSLSPSPLPIPSASPVVRVTPPAVGSARVDVLNAANAAFQRGDMAEAAQLYERVVNTPASAAEAAAAQSAINDYAHFRAMIALLSTGDEDQARDQLDALQSRDQNAPLARLAAQVWDQYGMTASVKAACAQAQASANQASQALSTLQALGVPVDPNSLCSVP
jgi:hypothetical protein